MPSPIAIARTLSLLVLLFTLPAPAQDVLTYHNNNARTGLNNKETILTPTNVNTATFGRLFTLTADGLVDAQPLYLSAVTISGVAHNVLIVATEHGTVYAFDSDTGANLWHITTLKSGETTSDDRGCGQVSPEIGITSTPVAFRPKTGNPVIYVVAMSKDSSGGYHQRLHALDATSGAELHKGPVDISAKYPGTGDNSSGGFVIFDPAQYKERAGLLLTGGTVYLAWASHCDIRPYTGWIMGYNMTTLAQTTVLNVTPNGNEGAIWGAGAGMAADTSGNIILLDANGDFDSTLNSSNFPANGDYGNAFLRLTTAGGLAVADYFEMDNESSENGSDTDLGSGGALIVAPKDTTGKVWNLAVGAGKDTNLYVVDRTNMGKFNSGKNANYQELSGALPGGIWSMPAAYNNRIYYGPVGSPILAFQFVNARLTTKPVAQTTTAFGYPGATPSVSSNVNKNGIVWATENTSPAVLHAYNAINLQELYNSNQAANGIDHFGNGNKYITPTIANGKVYVGTTNGVGVFALRSDK
jgi:outer membrane protein assembly factor BamB